MIYRAGAIPAWNAPAIPAIFLLSALTMGGGLFLTAGVLLNEGGKESAMAALLICLIADMTVWAVYLIPSGSDAFLNSRAFFCRPSRLFLVIGVGYLFPLAILTELIVADASGRAMVSRDALLALAGILAVSGEAVKRVGIILGASFLMSVRMTRKQSAP